LHVKNKAEGDSIVSYLKCKLPLVIYSLTKTSRTIDGPQTRFIPEVPFNKIWNDVDVYNHFGLTQTEIDYIEKRY
jgi:diphthamide biosynthesis methyltransferase